ncbi:MAG: hypothetical protein U0572_03930 [Phycisphaerales bacterium]
MDSEQASTTVAEVDLPDPASTVGWLAPQWSANGQRILVERYVDARAWPWFDEHRADLGPALALSGIAIGVWWCVRTLRRPRMVGHSYCRRCNQALDSSRAPPARCPECGAALSARRIVIGRSWARRLVPVALLAIVMTLSGAFLAKGSIATSSAKTVQIGDAWPVAALDRFSWWPLWRAEMPRRMAIRVDVAELTESGGLRLVGTTPTMLGTNASVCASDDGRVLAWAVFNESNGWRHEIRWFDVDANRTGSAIIGTNSDGFIRVCHVLDDGNSIIVRRDRNVVAPDSLAAADVAYPVDVLVVDRATGRASVVATSDAVATNIGPSSWRIEPGVAAVSSGPKARWATMTLPSLQTPKTGAPAALARSVKVGGDGGVRDVVLRAEQRTGQSPRRAVIEDDRWLVVDVDDPFRTQSGAAVRERYRIDLETGDLAGPFTTSPSGLAASVVASSGTGPWRTRFAPVLSWIRLRLQRE